MVWARTVGLLAVVLLGAIIAVLLLAARLMAAPAGDLTLLAVLLVTSGAGSLLLGALALHLAGGRLGSLRMRLALASGVGLLVVLINVLTTSALMFLNTHDLTLLVLLLAFAAAVSLAFGYVTTGMLSADLERLAHAAGRFAEGDLSARVGARGGDEVGRVAHAFDRMAERLQHAFERQRTLESERRGLVTAVSHDLRTPLSTTRAMVEALADGVVTEPADVQRYLSLIRGEIQHLSGLINDLFELSQIDAGELHLRRVPLDVGALVEDVVAAYQAPAAVRGIALTANIDVAVKAAPLLADPDRLQRVVRNLLDNALRHTPAGGAVHVGACLTDRAMEMAISDSGPGIPAQDRERIFERFYRGEPSRTRTGPPGSAADGGSGLGLVIARALVEAHEGRIWAEPSPLGGATFRLRLPLPADNCTSRLD
jgi:signal transduction histidine kinase